MNTPPSSRPTSGTPASALSPAAHPFTSRQAGESPPQTELLADTPAVLSHGLDFWHEMYVNPIRVRDDTVPRPGVMPTADLLSPRAAILWPHLAPTHLGCGLPGGEGLYLLHTDRSVVVTSRTPNYFYISDGPRLAGGVRVHSLSADHQFSLIFFNGKLI